MPLLDYGARFYNPALARWTTLDPLAEKYYSVSPYAFCNNNPVNLVDPDGRSWGKAVKVVKKIHKTVKAGNKVSVKNILKSEALDIADNVKTIFDSEASGFDKGVAAFDLATGLGDEAKWVAKTVGVSDVLKNRVKLRKGTKETIINNAPKTNDGQFIDPNTELPIDSGQEVFGHKTGNEWKKYKNDPKNQGKTRKEVIEEQNNPDVFKLKIESQMHLINMKKNKEFCIKKENITKLVGPMGYCIASDYITTQQEPIGYMYREEPEDIYDSGWRFLSGKETEDYVNNAENFGLYEVNTIANYDRSIIPYLNYPIGSELCRNNSEFLIMQEK